MVKASSGEPDRQEIESTKGSTINTKPKFSVPFEIHDLTTENFTMLKQSFCNSKHRVWLRSETLVDGGNSGYANAMIKMYLSREQGSNTLNKIMGSVSYFAQTQDVAVIGSSIS